MLKDENTDIYITKGALEKFAAERQNSSAKYFYLIDQRVWELHRERLEAVLGVGGSVWCVGGVSAAAGECGGVGSAACSVGTASDGGTSDASACEPLQGGSSDAYFVLNLNEENKNIGSLQAVLEAMLQANLDRDSVLVNIGGGVCCDLGGLAAALYNRGIDFIQIPTTLLSMVDASVGGKTAINLKDKKNIIGAFCRPKAVYIDPIFLNALPREDFLSGLGEIFKVELLSEPRLDIALWQALVDCAENGNGFGGSGNLENVLIDAIKKAVEFKINVVGRDFLDRGERKILNFGHSFAHAMETYYLKRSMRLSHGRAVVWGILLELYISFREKSLEKDFFELSSSFLLKHYGLWELQGGSNRKYATTIAAKVFALGSKNSTNSSQNGSVHQAHQAHQVHQAHQAQQAQQTANQTHNTNEILSYMLSDKKNKNGRIALILLQEEAKPVYNEYISKEKLFQYINEAYDYYKPTLIKKH